MFMLKSGIEMCSDNRLHMFTVHENIRSETYRSSYDTIMLSKTEYPLFKKEMGRRFLEKRWNHINSHFCQTSYSFEK